MTSQLSQVEKGINENVIDPNDNVSIMELLECLISIQSNSKDIINLIQTTKTSFLKMENDLSSQMELLDRMFNLLKTN